MALGHNVANTTRSSSLRKKSAKNDEDLTSKFTGILTILVLAGIAFYLGLLSGMHASSNAATLNNNCRDGGGQQRGASSGVRSSMSSNTKNKRALSADDMERVDKMVKERVKAALAKESSKNSKEIPRFTPGMKGFAVGASKTTKKEFTEIYDYGYARYQNDNGSAKEALIIYQDEATLPTNAELKKAAKVDDGNEIPMMGARDATANCDAMNVVVLHASHHRQCFALMDNYESYHLQQWMRIGNNGSVDPKLPLRHVGRGMTTNGGNDLFPPSQEQIETHWDKLVLYLKNVDRIGETLKPILERIAKKKTVVVMVSNLGQSSLLTNFACSSKARGIDLSSVLVFATDEETQKIAEGLGLTSFYDDKIFSGLPTKEAQYYGDATFGEMMYAKVIAVHLVNMLEYDLLFQDVDNVWYKDPVPFFQDTTSAIYDFDMIFQDDGARSRRFAPYSANTGFYFVRFNERTRYLMMSMVYSSDLILAARSHQEVLNEMMVEHASLYALRVKTMEGDEFPGGAQYHRNRDRMRDIISGKKEPMTFHMSWTENKANKLKFMQQMGWWYLADTCLDDGITGVLAQLEGKEKVTETLQNECCLSEPKITCHYKDKPSAIPCNQSPAIDKNGRPFWPEDSQQ